MGLRNEVHGDIRSFFFKQTENSFPVADISLHKAEAAVIHHLPERRQITGVRQFIQAHDPVSRMRLQHVKNEIGAYVNGE
jgi:hypothetical protein